MSTTDLELAPPRSGAASGAARVARRRGLLAWLGIYFELAKARLGTLVVVTTAVGFALGSAGPFDWARFIWTLLGTGLTAFGANILNQWMEAERDARMERTRVRPLPSGRVRSDVAFLLGVLSVVWGLLFLAAFANLLTAGLALLTELIYLGLYTPMKVRSPLCTLVGAICGAIPPLMGWTAATGGLHLGGWVLGAILFVWQIPHFLALAWLYRDDYERGGYRMLPVIDRSGRMTSLMAVLYSLALVPLGFAAMLAGMTGWVAAIGAIVLGAGLFWNGLHLRQERTALSARRLFLASLIYLPLLLGLLVADNFFFSRNAHVILVPPAKAESAVRALP